MTRKFEVQPSDIRAVTDAVRRTGKSAHPKRAGGISELVHAVAIDRILSPRELQTAVERYADGLDADGTDWSSRSTRHP